MYKTVTIPWLLPIKVHTLIPPRVYLKEVAAPWINHTVCQLSDNYHLLSDSVNAVSDSKSLISRGFKRFPALPQKNDFQIKVRPNDPQTSAHRLYFLQKNTLISGQNTLSLQKNTFNPFATNPH